MVLWIFLKFHLQKWQEKEDWSQKSKHCDTMLPEGNTKNPKKCPNKASRVVKKCQNLSRSIFYGKNELNGFFIYFPLRYNNLGAHLL